MSIFHFSSDEIDTITLTLRVAAVAAVCALPLGIMIAWLLSRKTFPLKYLLDAVIHLPLVLPPVVIGYVLLVLLGSNGWIGKWLNDLFGIQLAFAWTGAALASAIMGFPLLVRTIRLSFDNLDVRLEAAAATLGASRGRIFFTIVLPQAWPGILAGLILCFARALGEFGATITFVSSIPGETQTIATSIYQSMQTVDGESRIWKLAIVSIVISMAALMISEALSRRSKKKEAR